VKVLNVCFQFLAQRVEELAGHSGVARDHSYVFGVVHATVIRLALPPADLAALTPLFRIVAIDIIVKLVLQITFFRQMGLAASVLAVTQ
jgi:hypothetical protein